jgi:serine/threonine protein kinase
MSAQTGQAVDPNPLIGQSIGKYRIVKLLGQGGMGAVFEAQHETINQRVAIKVLHKKLTSDETSVQRFMHEARTTSLVHHPGLVKVHDFGQLPDGAAYMMMEYLDGESLKSRLSARGKLDSRDALRIVRQLAAALAVAHEKGVIHRDLKPESLASVGIGNRASLGLRKRTQGSWPA